MNRYKVKSYKTSGIYLQEGWYSEEEIKKIIRHLKFLNNKAKEMASNICNKLNGKESNE